jgi:hypothetical protein
MPVPVAVGDLSQGLVEHGDVVGSGVRPGVARPQRGGEELPGVVQECQQRVVAEGVLERRRGLLLLAVTDQHVRVQVDHQRVQPGRAGRPGTGRTRHR